MLFQLILLEEVSDSFSGSLQERLSQFCEAHGIRGDFDAIAQEIGVAVPAGRTVLDALVKLRNAAAHNGQITEESLKQFKGEWVIPLIADKEKLHKLVGEVIRYLFASMAGHSREKSATLIELKADEKFEVRFD